jgi:hypothetical protein
MAGLILEVRASEMGPVHQPAGHLVHVADTQGTARRIAFLDQLGFRRRQNC